MFLAGIREKGLYLKQIKIKTKKIKKHKKTTNFNLYSLYFY